MQVKPRIRLVENVLLVETSFDNDWINDIKRCIPIAKRSWNTQVGIWTVDPSFYQCVLEITRRHFGNDIIDATGGVGHPQDMDWKAKIDSAPMIVRAGKLETPRSILFVSDSAPDYIITAAYRALAARNHPDKGGSEAAMQRINAAYEKLK